MSFVILNLDQARFECTFGRGCDGICCRNGRPPVYPEESARIEANLPRLLPMLRPEARALVERQGYLSRRQKAGQPMMRVAAGWCVFFHHGCVLHRAGAEEGDPFRYKPAICAVFPLDKDRRGRWYIRQKGFHGEVWDLFCLSPQPSTPPAVESLAREMLLAEEL